MLLPEKSPTADVVFDYLFGRGIDYEIINHCLEQELIIESLPYHNAVFIGYDENKEPKYDVPLWHRPILSVAEATEYFGIGSNKIYELTEKENCPFVIWIGSRRVIKRTAFERFLEKQYSI